MKLLILYLVRDILKFFIKIGNEINERDCELDYALDKIEKLIISEEYFL